MKDESSDIPAELLRVERLGFVAGSRRILEDVSLSLKAGGGILGLLGPNGAGKSTLFRCIMGFERGYLGRVSLSGAQMDGLPAHLRSRRGIGYLSQDCWLFRDMSCEDNLVACAELLEMPGKEAALRARALLEEFGLAALSRTKASVLSGGEKKRLEIARSMLFSPSVFLLDEPFTELDPKTATELESVLLNLKSRGISLIISDHQAERIFSIAQRICFIAGGRILAEGAPPEIKGNALVRSLYLGK